MLVSAGWVSQLQAARGQAGKISPKYEGAETPDHPAVRALFVLVCPPESPWLFLPASL